METGKLIWKGPYEEARCMQACPAGVNIPRFIDLISENKLDEALAVIRERNPFPSVCGHVCLSYCEAKCRRNEVDKPVAINALERYVTEHATWNWLEESRAKKTTNKRVAIVGSGPAGLTAAYYLTKFGGHSVCVFEALPKPGGMMYYGIPNYRLPKDVLDREIEAIKCIGVDIKTNTKVESLGDLFEQGYDSILLTIGNHNCKKIQISGSNLQGVLLNTSFLKDINIGNEIRIGKKIVVLGGGNVAFDCARSALRLGATEVHLVCLEPRDDMLASPDEIEEGEQEGIIIHTSQSFNEIIGDGIRVVRVKCLDIRSFKLDDEGRAHVDFVEDSEHILSADNIIFSIGQLPDLEIIKGVSGISITKSGLLNVDPITMSTGIRGVFAAGDAVTGTVSVIEAVASGKKAAVSIDRYLEGDGTINEILAPRREGKTWLGYNNDILNIGRLSIPLLSVEKRINNFTEVKVGFTKEMARSEERRCLRCDQRVPVKIDVNQCRECYSCQMICSLIYQGSCNPSKARILIDDLRGISFTKECIGGCSLCISHCPYSAISVT